MADKYMRGILQAEPQSTRAQGTYAYRVTDPETGDTVHVTYTALPTLKAWVAAQKSPQEADRLLREGITLDMPEGKRGRKVTGISTADLLD